MESQQEQKPLLLQTKLKPSSLSPSPPPSSRSLHEVEEILGYEFKNKSLLEQAFTHSTYNNNSFSYERLEFIGDAVLNLLMTKEQYFSYPNLGPGKLTRLRSANVDTEKLARVAVKHRLHHYLRHNKPLLDEQIQQFCDGISEYPLHSNGLIEVPKSLADIVESTVGAVFIDCDSSVDTVWKVFKRLLEPIIDPNTIKIHPVTELHEICQKRNLVIKFVDSWKESKAFNVFINGKLVGIGKHVSKKEVAYNRAAKNALDNIEKVFNEHPRGTREKIGTMNSVYYFSLVFLFTLITLSQFAP
ncbi:hypothetical protein RIF29_24396 [Crotalaria pallida]|uniref:RNase III domain-containing protein n=1 Tax=Crotalaria pallida TaxID=3830 RepID=A0AAN9EJP5_CROPI